MNRTGEKKSPSAINYQRPSVVSHAFLRLLALAECRRNQQAKNKDQNTKPSSQCRHNHYLKIEQCQSKLELCVLDRTNWDLLYVEEVPRSCSENFHQLLCYRRKAWWFCGLRGKIGVSPSGFAGFRGWLWFLFLSLSLYIYACVYRYIYVCSGMRGGKGRCDRWRVWS